MRLNIDGAPDTLHKTCTCQDLECLQAIKPGAAWEGCTPVPLEQLYSCILTGRLDLRLPLAIGQTSKRAILLSRLMAMPAQQHLNLQVTSSQMTTPRT